MNNPNRLRTEKVKHHTASFRLTNNEGQFKGNICRKRVHRPISEGQFFKSSQISLSCITKIPKLKKVCNTLFEKLLGTVHELTQAFDMLHQNIPFSHLRIMPLYPEWVPCSRTTDIMGSHGRIVCYRDWMCDLLVYNMIWPSGLTALLV